MDEDEVYRRLSALKDRQDAKLPGIGAENDPLYHELDFRVQYELAIRSTRGPHVKDVHEHLQPARLRAADQSAHLARRRAAPIPRRGERRLLLLTGRSRPWPSAAQQSAHRH